MLERADVHEPLDGSVFLHPGSLAALDSLGVGDLVRSRALIAPDPATNGFAMEVAQLFIPNRVASIQDVAANTAGTVIGVLLFADPVYSLVTRPLMLVPCCASAAAGRTPSNTLATAAARRRCLVMTCVYLE